MSILEEEERHRDREKEGHVMKEAEIRGIQLQTEECWQPPEARKGQGKILPEGLQGDHHPAGTLVSDFCIPEL